jgi:ABC-type sugar transport system substrate-binding protein
MIGVAPAVAQQPNMTKEAPTTSSPVTTSPGSSTAGPITPKKDLKLGMLIPHRTNPFWVAFAKSAEQAAKSLGVDLRIVDYENREEKQIDTLQGLISGGVNGLIVVPHNTQMGPAILDMAGRNNLPVTVADRWPGVGPDSGKYIGFVGSNDEKAGYDIASELLRQGCKNIVINNGLRGHSGYQARTRGRTKATSEHPEVKILREEWANSVRAEGTKTTEAWLTAMPGPEFDCLYGGNDDWAMGAWKVLADRGVANKVKIAGLDLIPEVVEKLKNGQFAVSAGGHWYEGGMAVTQMFDYLHGIKPAQDITLVTDIVITKDSAARFEEQFIKHPPEIDWKQRSRVFNPKAPTGFVVQFD